MARAASCGDQGKKQRTRVVRRKNGLNWDITIVGYVTQSLELHANHDDKNMIRTNNYYIFESYIKSHASDFMKVSCRDVKIIGIRY